MQQPQRGPDPRQTGFAEQKPAASPTSESGTLLDIVLGIVGVVVFLAIASVVCFTLLFPAIAKDGFFPTIWTILKYGALIFGGGLLAYVALWALFIAGAYLIYFVLVSLGILFRLVWSIVTLVFWAVWKGVTMLASAVVPALRSMVRLLFRIRFAIADVLLVVFQAAQLILRYVGSGGRKPPNGRRPTGGQPQGDPEGPWLGLWIIIGSALFVTLSLLGVPQLTAAIVSTLSSLLLVSVFDLLSGNTLGLNLAIFLGVNAVVQRLYEAGILGQPIVEGRDLERIQIAVNQRRDVLLRRLNSKRPSNKRFFEVPQPLQDHRALRVTEWLGVEESSNLSAFQRNLLHAQSDRILIGYRLLDLITALAWIHFFERGEQIELPVLHMVPDRRRTQFGWRVDLEMGRDALNFYLPRLREYEDWLAIRIHWIPPRGRVLLNGALKNMCKRSDTLGSVGGRIALGGSEYGMTCAHIFERGCACVDARTDPQDINRPDLGLIPTGGTPSASCYEVPREAVSDFKIPDHSRELVESKVIKLNGRYRGCEGTVDNTLNFSAKWAKRPRIKFLHVQIKVRLMTYFGRLFINPFQAAFSNAGDSGCWVVDRDGQFWFGVLVSRDGIGLNFQAVEAKESVAYLKNLIEPDQLGGLTMNNTEAVFGGLVGSNIPSSVLEERS